MTISLGKSRPLRGFFLFPKVFPGFYGDPGRPASEAVAIAKSLRSEPIRSDPPAFSAIPCFAKLLRSKPRGAARADLLPDDLHPLPEIAEEGAGRRARRPFVRPAPSSPPAGPYFG